MIAFNCEQYSPEWWELRLGKPTASKASEIVTSSGKRSKSLDFLAFVLGDQIKHGVALDSYENEWMKRGSELEQKARELYMIETGIDIVQTGMIFRDDKIEFGCSPDGIGIRNGLECKCLKYDNHQKIRFKKELPIEKKAQVYSSLWICDELEWWDFFSYYPDLPSFLCRATRQDKDYKAYVEGLEEHLPELLTKIKEYSK